MSATPHTTTGDNMSDETTELKPCFCGRIPKIETRYVEPKGDRFFSEKNITVVLCECGQCLFDGAFHEGFVSDEEATTAWNYRVAPSTPEGVAEMELALERIALACDAAVVNKGWVASHARAALAKYRGEA